MALRTGVQCIEFTVIQLFVVARRTSSLFIDTSLRRPFLRNRGVCVGGLCDIWRWVLPNQRLVVVVERLAIVKATLILERLEINLVKTASDAIK